MRDILIFLLILFCLFIVYVAYAFELEINKVQQKMGLINEKQNQIILLLSKEYPNTEIIDKINNRGIHD